MSTHHKENNARLKPEVLALLSEQAQAAGQTPDELANELLGEVLKMREASKSDERWHGLFKYGREQAKRLGIKETDVVRLVKETRAEHRGR